MALVCCPLPLLPADQDGILSLDRVTLSWSELLCNLEVLQDPWYLFKEQVAAVAREAFLHRLICGTNYNLSLTTRPCSWSLPCLGHLLLGFLQFPLHGTVLEVHWGISTKLNVVAAHSDVYSKVYPSNFFFFFARIALAYRCFFFPGCNSRHWSSPLKCCYGTEWGHLQNHPSLRTSTHPPDYLEWASRN